MQILKAYENSALELQNEFCDYLDVFSLYVVGSCMVLFRNNLFLKKSWTDALY